MSISVCTCNGYVIFTSFNFPVLAYIENKTVQYLPSPKDWFYSTLRHMDNRLNLSQI